MAGRREVGEIRVNPYALRIDFNAIEKLEHVLETIDKNQASDINAWRVSKGTTVEDHIRAILEEAKAAHDCTNEPSSRQASEMIARVLGRFDTVVWLKLHYEQDTPARVASVKHDIDFEQLNALLNSMHTKPITTSYRVCIECVPKQRV
jgi:hypothetical protein